MYLVSSGTGHWNWTGSWEKNTDMIFEEKREQAIRVNRREEGRRKGKERSGGGGYLRAEWKSKCGVHVKTKALRE